MQARYDSYLVWQASSGSVRVLLDRTLAADLVARLQATRSREFGGILLGEWSAGGDGLETRVAAFEPLPLEDAAATHYTLTAGDRRKLRSRLTKRTRNGLVPVGLCRSHLRRGAYLDQRDFELFRNFFGGPESVFLLVRPKESGAAAAFFVWEEGDVRRHEPYREIPLQRDAPTGVRPAAVAVALPAARSRWRPRTIAAAAALAAAILAPAIFFRAPVPASPADARASSSPGTRTAVPIGLRIRQTGTAVELVWNGASAALASADHGHIFLRDGSREYQILLNREELAAGHYRYQALGDTVAARLEIFQAIPELEATATLVRPETTHLQAPAAPPQEPPASPAQPARSSSARRGGGGARVAPPAGHTLQVPAQPSAAPEFVPAPPAVAAEPRLQPPPAIRSSAPAGPSAVALLAVEAAPQSRMTRALRKVPGIRSLAGRREPQDFVAARPLQRPLPQPQAGAPAGENIVELLARVDRTGRVVETALRTGDRRLCLAARDAVNRWVFDPARIDGTPVPSEILLRFAFRNPR